MNASGSAAQEGAASLRDYLWVVRRRKWLILLPVVVVPAAAVAFSLQQKPVYRASASVLLSRQNLANTLNGLQDPTLSVQPDRLAQTQADLARSPVVARQVLAKLRLRDRSVKQFLGESSVSPAQNADVLTFTVRDTSRTLAVGLVRAYAMQYRTYRHQLDTQALQAARQEVQTRIEALPEKTGALYANLVDKEQQLSTMEALQTSNATVIAEPTSATQVSPRPKRNGALGLMLGLVLGVGLAFLRESLDTRVHSSQEIGERLALPLLARIPEPPRRLRSDDKLAMLAEPSGVHAEAFRMLRTNLEFTMLGHQVRTLMVTSALEQEGKSTTIANLALALARGGQRVILVDLDLRRPYLQKFFGLGTKPGITQVVLGRASLQEALVHVPISAIEPHAKAADRYDLSRNGDTGVNGWLGVLASGPIPPDPGEFSASVALSEVLAQLRERADLVLIDAPPLLHVGDALTLSAKVDALMLVTKPEALRRPMLTDLRRLLENAPTLRLGFIVTGSDAEGGYGYGYAYGHTYQPRLYEPDLLETR